MESCDSGVTSPVLRVTAEISELRRNPASRENGKNSISPSIASKDGRTNLFTRKKLLNPLYGHNPYQRSSYAGSYISSQQNPKNNVSSFTQRVMSAKLLRTKQLQNQLAETQMKLNEVIHENKTLRTLQQRQDSVLKKYEGNQEQLPQLLKSHHEEIRVLNEKYKQLRANYRELESRMKQKDNELTNLREQYKHLLKLSRDKHLGERERLTQKVEEMEGIIEQQKNKILTLDKKLSIEEKNHRYQLNQEITRYKKAHNELNSALETISNLKATIEAKERFTSVSYPRYQQSAPTTMKASHVSLPAPPRVSIRQTQRLAHSDSALQQEDSETAESFTINYSPGDQRSSSADSDNLSSPCKEEIVNAQRISMSSKQLGMIPGGIHISKEAFRERRAMRRSGPDKEINIIKSNTAKGKEEINQKLTVNESSTKEKENNVTLKAFERESEFTSRIENRKKEEETENLILEKHYEKTNDRDIDEGTLPETKNFAHLETPEDRLFTEIEKEINAQELTGSNMKIEMDEEFEKFLESTKLSDEAISEYFKRDFKAEINEIERKFQDLDKASERYMKMGKKVNGTSFYIPNEGETESEEEEATYANINGENDLQEEIKTCNNSETNPLSNGAILGETQKAYLLKALNNIDESSTIEKKENEEAENKLPTNKANSSTIPISTFSRTKRKSLIMKDLFGSEGTKL